MGSTECRSSTGSGGVVARLLSSPPRFLLLVAAYFGLQIVLRLITSGTADLDESEQLLATQQLQWGYGPQPPLYTWLQYPLVQLLGPGILALALLKNLLLFGIYALTYWNARMVTQDHARSVVATLSLLFIPQIAWESQRDLTHSVIVTLAAVATFHGLLKLHRRAAAGWYVALGFFMGLGLLSKYSFGVFLGGILLAALTLPGFRPIVWNWRMLGAVLLCGLVIAPHLNWAMEHAQWVMATSKKLGITTSRPWLQSTVAGLTNMVAGLAVHLGALLGIYLLVCRKRTGWVFGEWPKTAREPVRLIWSSLAVMFVFLLTGNQFFKVTGFKDRWFLPLCVWIPILLVTICAGRLDPRRMRWLAGLAAVVALVVAILIPTRIWLAKTLGRSQTLNAPFAELAKAIRGGEPSATFFVAGDNWMGGNLKRCFPKADVLSPRMLLEMRPQPGARGLLVWDARKGGQPPPDLQTFAAQFLAFDTNGVRYLEAPLQFWPEKRMRIAAAPCRAEAFPISH